MRRGGVAQEGEGVKEVGKVAEGKSGGKAATCFLRTFEIRRAVEKIK